MQAVILAGGLGTRLRPITYVRPKALVPLANKPMVMHIIESLPKAVDEVLLAANYRIEALEKFFRSVDLDVRVTVVDEGEPMGTGGALKNLEDRLEGLFLVYNGDVITFLDASLLLEFHKEKGGIGALALRAVENPEAYGIVQIDTDGRIRRFLEKPKKEEVFSNLINAGVYTLDVAILDRIESGKVVSIEREVFPLVLQDGLYGYPFEGYWADAGTLESYLSANRMLLEKSGTSLDREVHVAPQAGLLDPIMVARGTFLKGGVIGPFVTLGEGCSIDRARIANSVLLDGVVVEDGAIIENSIIGEKVTIQEDARIERSIVADDMTVAKGSKIVGERVGK